MENTLENNPIAQEIVKKIKHELFEDMSKQDIKEKIKDAFPNFPDHMFEICYSEAFTTLVDDLSQLLKKTNKKRKKQWTTNP